jgi:diacylglycerol O-acyltransferase / wax synthase
MKLLSALDALFLHLETPDQPMHVGGLNVFVMPKGYRANFYKDVVHHIESRLHLAPLFTRTLTTMPLGLTNPGWRSTPKVDLDWHIQKVSLPAPGGVHELNTLVAQLHSELLPRDRPLWRMFVIEGLNQEHTKISPHPKALSNKLFGFYAVFHHAALDGQGGVALAKAILDLEAKPVIRKAKSERQTLRATASPKLTTGALLAASFRGLLGQYVEFVKAAPNMGRGVGEVLRDTQASLIRSAKGQSAQLVKQNKPLNRGLVGPKTRLNVAISNKRVFTTTMIPLNDVKSIGHVMGGSLNDAVLAIVSGGLRSFLQRHAELPKKSLICAMPVSLRKEAQTDARNIENQSSMVLTTLATDKANPIERLQAIIADTTRAKELSNAMKTGMPTDVPSLGIPWLLTGLTKVYSRSGLANALPPIANVVVSNVPGPPVPLYMAGAFMASYYPVSIVVHSIALNITLQSYAGQLGFGLIACAKALPDIEQLKRDLEQSFEELKVHCENYVPSTNKPDVQQKQRRPRPRQTSA